MTEIQLDSDAAPVTADEAQALSEVVKEVAGMALLYAHRRPRMTTLLEEVAEAILASRGKHEHSLELELKQIASVCINLLWQMQQGTDVSNLQTKR